MLNAKPYEYFAENSVKRELANGIELRCLSAADLIELKKGTMREKDALDVIVLQRLLENPGEAESPSINLEVPGEGSDSSSPPA